jgi:hypothetical protein
VPLRVATKSAAFKAAVSVENVGAAAAVSTMSCFLLGALSAFVAGGVVVCTASMVIPIHKECMTKTKEVHASHVSTERGREQLHLQDLEELLRAHMLDRRVNTIKT